METRNTPQPWMVQQNRRPIDFETDIAALPLRGELPAGLEGLLVRNGPNPVVPEPGQAWFRGEGMLHAFRIQDGGVAYRNRWVRTKGWAYASTTGRNPGRDELPHDDGDANTAVVAHAGRLLALEEAHLPMRMDPATLCTLGVESFGGRVSGAFTAHPKSCPLTGELLFFGYGTPERLSAGMQFGVIDRDGQVLRVEPFEAPYASMVHDFAVTANHVVLPIMPLTGSLERARSGGPAYAWEPRYGTRVGIMRRTAQASEMVWWTGPACYVFHVMNAWELGSDLYVDVIEYDRAPMFPDPDGHYAPMAFDGIGRLVRWHFDLTRPGGAYTRTVLAKTLGEFPRIDERRSGLAYRHGWYVGAEPEADAGWRSRASLVHIDLADGRESIFRCEPGSSLSEPVFAPRSEEEGDGWILATVTHMAAATSELLILDAQDLAAGPLCTAHIPHRLPDGFHGQWFARGFDEQTLS